MYLDVKFKDGSVTHIPVSNSHTVRVISPTNGDVQDAFSFDGVESVTIDFEGAPAATDPTPAVNAGAAEGPTVDTSATVADPVPVVADPAPVEPAPADPAPVADAPVADAPPVEAVPVEPAADAVVPVAASGQPTTDGAPPVSDGSNDPGHDPAVALVQAAVVTADATPPDDRPAHVAKAQTDLAQALALWPDSLPLQDLKTELDALANETV